MAKMNSAVESIVKSLQAKFGEENITYLGNKKATAMERISSGSFSLDNALGGGWPVGRIVEIMGPESSGKSSICYHAMAEAQKLGWVVALVDTEYSHDPIYAGNIGVDNDSLIVSQPEDGTQALDILIQMLDGGVRLAVVDSVASLLPREEAESDDFGKATVGRQAQLMSKALRKLTPAVGRNKAIVIFTNQLRQKIGVMYGNPETTAGGESLKYYASIRCRVSTVSGSTDTAKRTKVKVIKNKTAVPFKETEFNIIFGVGIDKINDIVEGAIDSGLFQKGAGGVYTSKLLTDRGVEKIRGREKLLTWIKEQGEDFLEILSKEAREFVANQSNNFTPTSDDNEEDETTSGEL
jgi:recombination protein RecA